MARPISAAVILVTDAPPLFDLAIPTALRLFLVLAYPGRRLAVAEVR